MGSRDISRRGSGLVGGVPTPGTWLLVAVSVVAFSTSGPLIAAAAAPALAIAFWRNALAAAALVPAGAVSLARGGRRAHDSTGDRRSGTRIGRATLARCALAGLLLAGHFGLWVPSVKMTTVATSTALVCLQPVWAALLARILGRAVGRQAWLGIGLAVLGVVMVTGVDVTVSLDAVLGDLLALAAGIFGAGYVTVGERVRAELSTTLYTAICYAVCAVTLLVVCLAARVELTGFDARTWLLLVAMTVGPQFLGHSVINRILDTLPALVVSLTILLEVPGAALLAAVFLGQVPPLLALPGLLMLLAGLALVVLAARTARREAVAEPVTL